MTRALRLEAPAKLNLSLRVVGRRDDGYHLLESELVLLELADRLLLMPGGSGLRVDGPAADGVPVADDNLAWTGLRAALEGAPELVCLALEKRIPAAAGLGGGSSDAAAAWRLGRSWRNLPDAADPPDLERLAAIGADVPFFAARVPAARVTGVGERVEALTALDRQVVLVHPPFSLSTAAVFASLRPEEWGTGANDLLPAACRLRPELDDLLERVRHAGVEPQLTGSGPTIFALVDDPEDAAAVASRLAADGLRVTITRTRSVATSIDADGDDDENGEHDEEEGDP